MSAETSHYNPELDESPLVPSLKVVDANISHAKVPLPGDFELAPQVAEQIVALGDAHEYSDKDGFLLDTELAERVIAKSQPEYWLLSKNDLRLTKSIISATQVSEMPPIAKDFYRNFKKERLVSNERQNIFEEFKANEQRRLDLHTYLSEKTAQTVSVPEQPQDIQEPSVEKLGFEPVTFDQLPPAAGITGDYENIADLAPISKDGGARSPSTGRPGLINDTHLKQIVDRQDSIRAALQERFNPGDVKSLDYYAAEVQPPASKARRRATREQGIAEERNPGTSITQNDQAKDAVDFSQYSNIEKASADGHGIPPTYRLIDVAKAQPPPRNYRRSEREADSTVPEPAGQAKSQRIKSVFKKARAALSDSYASAGIRLTNGTRRVGEFYADADKGTERRTRTKRILAGVLGVVAAGGVGYLTYKGMSGGEHTELLTSIPKEQADIITDVPTSIEVPATPTPPRPEFITEQLSEYGDTISHHAKDLFNNHGYNAEYSSVSELTDAIQQANGISDEAAHHMAVGAEFKVPTLGGAEQITAQDAAPVMEHLTGPNDGLSNQAYDYPQGTGIENPSEMFDMSVLDPQPAAESSQAVVEAVQPAQEVAESLRALPESNPMTKGEVLGLLAISSSVAAMSQLHRIDDMGRARKAEEVEEDEDDDDEDEDGKSK